MKDEINIKGSDLINISCTKKILNQMMNCICKIKLKGANGTGFFCTVPLNENKNINFLMTNYHILNEKYIKENKEINILLNDDTEARIIDLNIKRIIYYNKEYDTTIIELKEEDNIKEYLELDDNIFKDNEKLFYEEKSIYIIQYPKGQNGEGEACVSYGILKQISNKFNIIHKCSTDSGSSGSPILNLKNNKVIGIHKGSPDYTKEFNYGTLLKYPLNDFINKNKTKNIIIGEIYKNKFHNEIEPMKDLINQNNEKLYKNPKNLRFLSNLTTVNTPAGWNDEFEVFTSKNDNKEYLVSPNVNNFHLDIFDLSNNKLVNSLEGHNNNITTVRYNKIYQIIN